MLQNTILMSAWKRRQVRHTYDGLPVQARKIGSVAQWLIEVMERGIPREWFAPAIERMQRRQLG